jgi:adenosylcobinamide-GDP ribazoletransferase
LNLPLSLTNLESILNQIKLFLIALQFYTRIPITGRVALWSDYSSTRLSSSTRYFTLVGIVVGVSCAAAYWLAHLFFPDAIAVVISVAIGVLMTGAFHEDGWADFCDAFGGCNSRARTLEIMTDSRIGSYGAIGIVLLLLLKVVTLNSMTPMATIAALLIMHPLSRACAVLIMASLPYAKPEDESKAKPIARGLAAKDLTIALTIALAFSSLVLTYAIQFGAFNLTNAVIACLLMFFAWWRLRSLMRARLQGYTGDALGATQQLTECLGYVGLASL